MHIWPDFAEENIITENRFENISLGGIRVEDDDTEVTQNLFVGDFDYIFLGAPFRARLADQPVQNTLIQSSFLSDEDTLFIDHLALMPDEHNRPFWKTIIEHVYLMMTDSFSWRSHTRNSNRK